MAKLAPNMTKLAPKTAKLVPTIANLALKTSFDFPRRSCKMSTKALLLRAGPSKIGLAWQ